MEINRNNYGSYFLDYIEGKLSEKETGWLLSFLSANPDLEFELNEFENVKIPSNFSEFDNKFTLKKNINNVLAINDINFDEFCIANFEGDLNKSSEKNLQDYLSLNPDRLKEFEFYSKTFLKPENSIVFSKKSSIKIKIIKPVRPIYYFISAAASLSLIFLVYKYYNQKALNIYNTTNEISISINEPIKNNSKNTVHFEPRIVSDKVENVSKKSSVQNSLIHNNIPLLACLKSSEFLQLTSMNLMPIIPTDKTSEVNFKNQENKNFIENPIKKIKKVISKSIPDKKDIYLFALAKSKITELRKAAGIYYEKDTATNRTIYGFESRLLSFYSSKENK